MAVERQHSNSKKDSFFFLFTINLLKCFGLICRQTGVSNYFNGRARQKKKHMAPEGLMLAPRNLNNFVLQSVTRNL